MPSKFIFETSSWRSGTLRPYESIGSIGAKYCYFNKIKIKEFAKVILDLIPENFRNMYFDYTLDNPHLDHEKFSKLLNEPMSIIKRLSFNELSNLPYLKKEFDFSLYPRVNFTYCPICLSEGYHSSFHQVNWISKCFIHGDPLVQNEFLSRPRNHLGLDAKWIGDLYDIWFSDTDERSVTNMLNWNNKNQNEVISQVNKIIRILKNTEANLSEKESHSQINISKNRNASSFLQILNSNRRLKSPIKNIHSHESMCLRTSIKYKCSNENAENIIKLKKRDFYIFMHSRMAICEEKNESSVWRCLLKAFKSNLISSHSQCLDEYKKSFEKIEKIRVKNFYYVHAPYDMASFERVPCPRIVTLNLLQIALDFEHDSLLSSRSISDLYYCSEESKRLLDLNNNLISSWQGNILRDYHLIMKEYNPDYILKVNDFDNKYRKVSMIIPLSTLADIIDDMLLAVTYTWIWALYITEKNQQLFEKNRISPEEFFRSKYQELFPAFIIQKTLDGLSLTIGSMVPYKMPNVKLMSADKRQHIKNVKSKSKQLAHIFDLDLAERMRLTDLQNARLIYSYRVRRGLH